MIKAARTIPIATFLASVLLVPAAGAQAPSLIPSEYLAPKYLALPDAPSSIVVAGPDEPGERLVVTGRVRYGTKLIAGVSVYVFHTDAKGFYAHDRSGPDAELDPRLHGALRTDAQGGYRYETIRPGRYNNNAAHVHYVVRAPGYQPRMFDLWFQDDPVLIARRRAGEPLVQQSLRNGPFYKLAPDDGIFIRPVIRDTAGVAHVVCDLDMLPE